MPRESNGAKDRTQRQSEHCVPWCQPGYHETESFQYHFRSICVHQFTSHFIRCGHVDRLGQASNSEQDKKLHRMFKDTGGGFVPLLSRCIYGIFSRRASLSVVSERRKPDRRLHRTAAGRHRIRQSCADWEVRRSCQGITTNSVNDIARSERVSHFVVGR